MQERPLEEELRRIIREEMATLEKKMDARFDAVDARFDAVDARFDAVDARFDRLEDALIIVAQASAGSIPERDSHVTRKVRRTLERSGPPSPLAQAAKGGS